jgi:hypothetical protein
MPLQALLVGLGAGAVSAVLFASASTGTLLGLLVLFLLSPMPVAIAGLGWGWATAALACGFGALLILFIGTPRAGIVYALTLGGPTVYLSHLILLNRTSGDGVVEWYPIGRVLAWLAGLGAVLGGLALVTNGGSLDDLKATFRGQYERFFQSGLAPGTDQPLGPEQIAALAEFSVAMLTSFIATMWIAIAAFNLWAAAHVTRISGQLSRPWPDLTLIAMPRIVPPAMAAAVLATFIPGIPGLVAAGVVSALLAAYGLVGLAIVHNVTRGMAARPLILGAIYSALFFLFALVAPVLALAAIAEPLSPLRRTPLPTA